MYIDIHTHHIPADPATMAILSLSTGDQALSLESDHIWYSLGLHPWKVQEHDWQEHLKSIEKSAVSNRIKAIGECGLDKLCSTSWHLQNEVFVAQIEISEKLKKPLIIHCVKSFDEIVSYKTQVRPRQIWIIHGFRGKTQQAEQLLKHGFFLSFGEKYHPETLRQMPLDRLFLETDDSIASTIEVIYRNVSRILAISEEKLMDRIKENVDTYFFSTT